MTKEEEKDELDAIAQEELSPCPKCNCMTKSVRLRRAKYVCGKCKADKSLSDVYYYEATHKEEKN